MATSYIKFFAVFFLSIITLSSTFSQTIILKDNKSIPNLGSSLSYFIDSENKEYTIEEIDSKNFDSKWTKNSSEHLNLGYLSVPVWLKVEIENKSSSKDWQFVLDMPFTDSIDFYLEKEGNLISHSQTGWLFPYHSRGKIKNKGFNFPLQISPNENIICYLRVRSNYPILLPISVLTTDQTHQEGKDSHIGHGIYFGILLVMMLYNLVIFFYN